MKVSISTTVEVSEEEREQLARVLDGKGARKRKATRAEFKDFIWENGKDWGVVLADLYVEMTDPQPGEDNEEEDLLGLLGDDVDDEDLI